MSDPEVGSESWLIHTFETRVRDEIFAGHHPNQSDPILVLLGGQPAAGKTQAQHQILLRHHDRDLVEITGDDLREYHPNYADLADNNPLLMPAATAPASGGLVRIALNYALQERYSVLLEGTFRDANMVTATTERFIEARYEVEVVAVATPAAVSRLSAEGRSLDADLIDYRGLGEPPTQGRFRTVGRWTPPDAHESALRASSGVLDALENLAVARIEVRSRNRLLLEKTRAADGRWVPAESAAAALRAEQSRKLEPTAAAAWLRQYQHIFLLAQTRPNYLGPSTAPAYRLLQLDASEMIRLAGPLPATQYALFEQQQQRRRVDLDRIELDQRSTGTHSSSEMPYLPSLRLPRVRDPDPRGDLPVDRATNAHIDPEPRHGEDLEP